jgi:hypothetical protein
LPSLRHSNPPSGAGAEVDVFLSVVPEVSRGTDSTAPAHGNEKDSQAKVPPVMT